MSERFSSRWIVVVVVMMDWEMSSKHVNDVWRERKKESRERRKASCWYTRKKDLISALFLRVSQQNEGAARFFF